MKKTIRLVLTAVLIFVASDLQAQFGIQIGYDYIPSKGNLSLGAGGHFSGTARNNGFQAGITCDFTIKGELGIQTALLYSFAGGTTKENDRRINNIFGTQSTKSVYQFVDLPVRVAYSLPVTNEFKFFVFGGPVFSYAFSGEIRGWEISGQYPNGQKTIDASKRNERYGIYDQYSISPFELKLGGGLGVIYNHFRVKAGYDFGLLNLYPEGTRSTKLRRNQLSLTVGYVF